MKKYFTLILLLPGFAGFAQKFSLALNLQKDSSYYLKSTNVLQIKQNIQGQQVDVSTTINVGIANKVLAIHDTVYSMQVSYVNMRMLMNAMGQTIDFNSDAKVDGNAAATDLPAMMGKMLNAIINKPFLMELSKTGHVLSIKNVDVLFDSMFSQLPNVSDDQKTQLKAQMSKSFGESSIKNSFQMAFPTFPAQKIGVNEKWTGSSTLQTTITVGINTTYTLNQVTKNAYLVTGEGVFVEDKNAAPATVNGMTTSFTGVTGKINTDYAFDKHTGWILSAKTKESMNGTMNMKMATGQEVTYPMEMTGEFTVLP